MSCFYQDSHCLNSFIFQVVVAVSTAVGASLVHSMGGSVGGAVSAAQSAGSGASLGSDATTLIAMVQSMALMSGVSVNLSDSYR